jgi:hypothetical protein
MSLNRANEYIPASIRISMETEPFWGRIMALSPDRVELLSQFEFRRGKMLALGFEFGGEKLEEIRGTAETVERDATGYFHYSIKLSDHNQQKTLLEKILRLTAKSIR